MDTIIFIAQVWGFSLVAICLSLLISPARAQKLYKFMEGEEMEFFHGIGHFVIGLVMVLNYNVWDASWKTIITALGWLLVISGIAYMFAPKNAGHMIAKLKKNDWVSLFYVAGVLLGCLLLYFSFTA